MSAQDHLNPDQFIDLYHHTTIRKANRIARTGEFNAAPDPEFDSDDPRAYFSDHKHGPYSSEYGAAAVHVRVPHHMAELDNDWLYAPESFYSIPVDHLGPEHVMGVERRQ